MSDRFEALLGFLQRALAPLGRLAVAAGAAVRTLGVRAWHSRMRLVIAGILAALAYALYIHPPLATVRRSEVLVRTSLLDGSARAYSAGTSWHCRVFIRYGATRPGTSCTGQARVRAPRGRHPFSRAKGSRSASI